jgi:RNA polymerase sigma-70 factor, ECF subfamily
MDAVRPEFADATWRTFRRVAIDGEPARAVAEELGMSLNAVLIAKSRVTARLRQEARGLVE